MGLRQLLASRFAGFPRTFDPGQVDSSYRPSHATHQLHRSPEDHLFLVNSTDIPGSETVVTESDKAVNEGILVSADVEVPLDRDKERG